MVSQIKFKQIIVLIIPILLIVVYIANPIKGILTLIIGIGGIGILSLFIARNYQRKVKIIRKMRYGWAHVGDFFEQQIIVQNGSLHPISWMEIQDESNIPGKAHAIGTSVGGFSSTTWQIKQKCTQRGLFTIGPTTLVTGDPFGIFRVTIHQSATTQVLVMPPILPLPIIDITGVGYSGDGRQRHRNLDQGTQTSTIRDYFPQDPIHNIHWPSSAKREKLISKTFESAPINQQWILLDLDTEYAFGEGQDSSQELGVILAASLIKRAVDENIPVGLVSNSKKMIWLTPQLGYPQQSKCFMELALAHPGDISLPKFINILNASVNHPASLILITSNLSSNWVSEIRTLQKKGFQPTVLLLTPNNKYDKVNNFKNYLVNLNINCHIISSSIWDKALFEKDATNTWEWRVMGTGRVVFKKQPGDASWKVIQ
jgi:uncharacterized protein (DUF58 family)